MQAKTWRDLTTAQRGAIVLSGLIQLTLLAAALRDIRRRAPSELHGSKRLWTAALFINFVGPIAYFLVGRKRS